MQFSTLRVHFRDRLSTSKKDWVGEKVLHLRRYDVCLQERLDAEHDKVWDALEVDIQLGMHCENYKWQQNQSHVEIYIHTPEGITSKQVRTQYVLKIALRYIQNLTIVWSMTFKEYNWSRPSLSSYLPHKASEHVWGCTDLLPAG